MRSERLTYEPLAVEHAAGLFAALDDERVGAYIGGPDVESVDATRQRITRVNEGPPADRPDERWINHAVLLDVAGVGATVIGRVEATTYGDWGEIAYLLGPQWWGHGYATEATAWMIDHLRDAHGVRELWAAVHADNAASMRLLERLGFVRVARPTRPLGSYDHGDVVFANPAGLARHG